MVTKSYIRCGIEGAIKLTKNVKIRVCENQEMTGIEE